MIEYPNIPGIVLGASLGVTAVIVGIPLLFLRSRNTPSRVSIAFAALGFGAALTLIPFVIGIDSGHGMLESAFSGNRGTAAQVASCIFGTTLLVAEILMRLYRLGRGCTNDNDQGPVT